MALDYKLKQWQSDLLDLSRANPLLYYKVSGRGSGIRMLEPPPGELFLTLLRTTNSSVTLDWIENVEDPDALERQLARLRIRTNEDLRDRGLQTLYIAFGLLEWRESPYSEERILTPLLLFPVTLGRKGAFGNFILARASDDDPEINPVFQEKMRSDFHITVPTYEMARERARAKVEEEGEEKSPRTTKRQIGLTDILQQLASILPAEIVPHIREEAHLGRFSFQKLVMYEDLRKHESEIYAHRLLRAIGGDQVVVPQPARLIDAHEIDTLVSPRNIMEILEADSSQQEAILAAKAGANFVLQGPPGTGKSQTIANIIAECLADGLKVLFVSEKMAALEVVWKRLRDAKLDDFLLNLHDPRQKRDGFLGNLAAALHNPSEPFESAREWEATSARLEQERNELNAYVRELHAPRFALQISAFDAYGKLAALHDAPRLDFTLADVPQINERQLAHLQRLLDDLKEHLDILDRFNEHPWRDTLFEHYSIALEHNIQAHLTLMSEALLICERDGVRLRAIVEPAQAQPTENDSACTPTIDQLRHAGAIAEHALVAPLAPLRSWLTVARSTELLAVAAQAQSRCNSYRTETAELDRIYRRTVCHEDLDTLFTDLTSSCADAVATLTTNTGQSAPDVAIMERGRIAPILAESAKTLSALLEAAYTVAADLDLPKPATTQDVARLHELAQHVVLTPRPPRQWLDANEFPRIAVLATEAHERAVLDRTLREKLSVHYLDDLYTLDIPSIGERFRTQYRSVLRIFNGQYRTDVRSVRSYLRTDGAPAKRTHAELCSDMSAAKQVVAAKGWLRDHRADLASGLGRLYDVQNPNWESVAAAIRWTQAFHQAVALGGIGGEASDTLCHLVNTGGPALDSLQAHTAALCVALDRWQRMIAPLQTAVTVTRLIGSAVTLSAAPLEALDRGVIATEQGLGVLWRAVDSLNIHRLQTNMDTGSPHWADLVHHVELARNVVSAERWLSECSTEYRESFGETFIGFETDWNKLQDGLRWSQSLARFYPTGVVPDTLVERVADDADPAAWSELKSFALSARGAVDAFEREMMFFATVLPINALHDAANTLGGTLVNELARNVRTLLETLPDLERLIAGRLHIQECREAGLGSLLDTALGRKPFPRDITSTFEQRFYALWLDAARTASRELGRFSGEKHEATIARYRLQEQEHTELTRRRLRAQLLRQRTQAVRMADTTRESPKGQALARLRKITGQKRPRGSIRQIVRSVGPVLLDLKPCWMMSPLSVSQFVEESGPIFDVVVFDEASQVRPEDAICAILRGRRLIVVGDSKQLPPSQFFTKEHRDDEDSDDAAEQQFEDGRRESILEECRATGMPNRALLWHYRSRHESLIAFSNHHFYDDKLISFPNPGDTHADGVRFEYVEGGLYDFGATRTNLPEAERVVDLIFEHLRRRPHLSLGVVALSSAQQDAIESALEARRKQDPESNAFTELLEDDRPEGLFIKNLESVQGDERDVIILSIGYGRASDGRIRYNFGPVNRPGGARRLNVAVTRAREQTILVSSVRASELSDSLASEGAQILRAYLDYAERGVAALHETQRDTSEPHFDSPFEESVFDALQRKGLRLATQVGCSGYRIDLAVRDPEMTERFLLGIECDGRTYHSSKTARDRDHLRQSHLESMGWKIMRIWSSEWRRDPDGQVARVMNRVREIREELIHSQRAAPAEPALVQAKYESVVTVDNSRTPPATDAARSRQTRSITRPISPHPAISGTHRAAEGADSTRNHPTSTQNRGYAPPGTEVGLLHQVASWAGGEFVCESCAHFTPLRPGNFTCSKLQRTQSQAPDNITPCCSWWKVK